MVQSLNKWLLSSVFCVSIAAAIYHPYHVSVVEMEHNPKEKTLEVSCKIFTDDFENALVKNFKRKIDLTRPAEKAAMDSMVKKYVLNHLQLRVNDRPVALAYVGFETEKEATYAYVQVENVAAVKKVSLTNSLLYDLFNDEVNIMHLVVGGNRKSVKLSYPEKEATLQF
jgi:hypothetical protein